MLDAIQGHATGDPYLTPAPARSFLSEVERDPRKLKIGVMVDPWNGERTDADIAASTLATAKHLEALGHDVFEVTPALGVSWESLVSGNAAIWCGTLVGWIEGLATFTGRPMDDTTLEPATLACLRYGKQTSAAAFADALAMRNVLTRSVGAWFEKFDVLLTPTLPNRPDRIGRYAAGAGSMDGREWTDRVFRHSPFTPIFNVAGVPAMSVPLGQEPLTGLPVGMQFASGFAREDVLFQLAGQLERSQPWRHRRPLVWAGDRE